MSEDRPSRWRRALRFVVGTALTLSIVSMSAYLLRRPLLESTLRRTLASQIGTALGAEVQVGRIAGNWIDTIVLEDVDIRSMAGPLEAEDLRIEVALSPRAAVGARWLDVVEGLRLRATRVRYRTQASWPSSEEPASTDASEPPTFAEIRALLLRLAPRGVEIDVADLLVESTDRRERGAFTARIEPGTELRRMIQAGWTGITIDGAIESGTATHANLRIDAPGRILGLFGIETPLQGGHAALRAELTDALVLGADVRLHDVALGRRGAVQAAATLTAAPGGTWEAEGIELRLPGAAVTAARVECLDPLVHDDPLDTLRGDVQIAVEDVTAFADLLPPSAMPWLPTTVQIRGSVGDRWLRVDEGSLRWDRGIDVDVAAGRLALTEDLARRSDSELRGTVRVAESQSFGIPGAGTLTILGDARVDLLGSLAAPTVDATINLGAGRFDVHSWQTISGTARYTGRIDEPIAYDLELSGAQSGSNPLAVGAIAGTLRGEVTPVPFDLRSAIDVTETETPASTARARLGLRGDVTVTTTAVATTGLTVRGPCTGIVRGSLEFANESIDLEATNLAFEVPALVAILGDLIRDVIPPDRAAELDARVEATMTASGPLRNPDATATCTVDLRNVASYLPTRPYPSLSTEALAAPATLALAVERSQRGIAVRQAELAWGTLARAAFTGAVPIRWDGNELVRTEGDAGLDGTVQVRLPLAAQGEVTPSPARIEDVTVDVEWRWAGDDFEARALRIVTRAATREQRLDGDAAIAGLTTAILGGRDWESLRVTGRIEATPFDLAGLPPSLHSIPILEGVVELGVTLDGPLSMPVERAEIALRNGRLKVTNTVPTLRDLQLVIRARPDQIEIVRATGDLGGGLFELSGGVTSTGPLWSGEPLALDVHLQGTDLLVARRTGLKVRADTDLTVKGTTAEVIHVDGNISLTSGAFTQRFSLVPDFRTRGGGVAGDLALPSIPDPLGSKIAFDVRLQTQEPFEVRSHVIEAPVRVDARLRGTGSSPFLEGSGTVPSGTVRLPAMSLQITQAVVSFDPARPTQPTIDASARGKRLGVEVIARVTGRPDKLEVQLSSTPAMAAEDITVLLASGRLPDDLRERGLQSQAAVVGTYLAQELLDFYLGSDSTEQDETLIDRFSFESGREVSRNGRESLTVEFDLREGFFLQAERDLYEDFNMGVLYRFKF